MKQLLVKYPNKFRAVLFNKPTAHVSVCFSMRAGAEQEGKSISGASHIIERMIKSELVGMVNEFGGVVESSVSYELISWTISSSREFLEDSIRAMASAVFDFFPKSSTLSTQKSKVLQEIEKQNFNPVAILNEITQKQMYKGTALSQEVIGSAKSVSLLELAAVKEFYTKMLSPQNICLSVVGKIGDKVKIEKPEGGKPHTDKVIDTTNFDPSWMVPSKELENYSPDYKITDSLNEVTGYINNYFYSRTIKLESKYKCRSVKFVSLNQPVYLSKPKSLNQTRFQISFPSAPYVSTGYKYSKLIETYLTYALREEVLKLLNVYGVNVSVIAFKNNGRLSVTFAADAEVAEERYAAVINRLKQIASEGVSEKEFNVLKNMYETTVSLYHESSTEIAYRFNKWLLIKDELFNLNTEIAGINAMTYENFSYTLNHILDFNKILVVVLGKKPDGFVPF